MNRAARHVGHRRRRHRSRSRRLALWSAIAATGFGLLAGIAVAVVYFASEAILTSRYNVLLRPASRPLAIPTDADAIAEGRRLARARGCLGGCHGSELAGAVYFEDPGVVRIVAPSLTQAARDYSDAELERVIRHGVRADGSSTFAMPSDAFSALSDDDLARILAFLRQAKPGAGPEFTREMTVWPKGRLRLLTGAMMPTAQYIVHELVEPPLHTPTEPAALGSYLARTLCGECHDPDMRSGGHGAPRLTMIASYPPEALVKLLRVGEAIGNRTLERKRKLAVERYAHLTDGEIAALDTYLRARVADLAIADGS